MTNSHGNIKYRIGIYTGFGASHSWLWFFDLFERAQILDIDFIDSESIINGEVKKFNVLIFSGGDTFSVAESIGERGAEKLKEFISSGGLYIGSCAGAYFPLNFDFPPLNYFNLVNAGVGNFTVNPPEPFLLPEKFSCPYGNGFVYHPFREDVKLTFIDSETPALAPVYGGPSFIINDDSRCIARYHAFTERTIFLCNKKYADEIYLNKPAIISKKYGNGYLLLCGPHLEHPNYREANIKLIELLFRYTKIDGSPDDMIPSGEIISVEDLKRVVSNLRVLSGGLVAKQWKWKVGRKTYEAEKILYFIEFVWRRMKNLNFQLSAERERYFYLMNQFGTAKRFLKELPENNTDKQFEKLLHCLKIAVSEFLKIYLFTQKSQRKRLYA